MSKYSTYDLTNNLRYHSAWVEICRIFLSRHPETSFAALLADLHEVEQSAVDLTARSLRMEGSPPATIDSDKRLVKQALTLSTEDARLRFVGSGLERSRAWYQEKLAKPEAPHQDLWQQLLDEQNEFVERHTGLLDLLAAKPQTD